MAVVKYYTYNRKKYAGYAKVDDDQAEAIMENLLKLKHVTHVEILKKSYPASQPDQTKCVGLSVCGGPCDESCPAHRANH